MVYTRSSKQLKAFIATTGATSSCPDLILQLLLRCADVLNALLLILPWLGRFAQLQACSATLGAMSAKTRHSILVCSWTFSII